MVGIWKAFCSNKQDYSHSKLFNFKFRINTFISSMYRRIDRRAQHS
jgi:hypothetical protein